MTTESSVQSPPLIPLLFLHLAAAIACFAFFVITPIVACVIFMIISDDAGGPMFFPMFVLSVLLFAAVITAFLAGAAFVSDLLRRRRQIPLWLPPTTVFLLATGSFWLLVRDAHPAVPLAVGAFVALAFIVHWTAISAIWFLPKILFKLFRVQTATKV